VWIIGLLFQAGVLHAQQSPVSVGLQVGVSYSGWNLAVLGQFHRWELSGYLGPSISLNRGLPGKGPYGLSSGLNYHIASKHDWLGSLVNIDYQLHFFSPAPGRLSMIHEWHLGYGIEFHFAETFTITQILGYGAYLESNAPMAELPRRNFLGYSGLLRVKASYRF
jgi:hypothetical protein